MAREIFVLPAFGQGHLFPAVELCKLLVSRGYKSTLVIFSTLASSVPSSFTNHPFVEVVVVPSAPPKPGDNRDNRFHQIQTGKTQLSAVLEDLIPTRLHSPARPVCAIVDVLVIIKWAAEIFANYGIPTVGFFTSGGCSAAMEYAIWKARPVDIEPGETRPLPGLPEEMGITYSDINRRTHGPPPSSLPGPGPGGPKKGGLPGPGDEPPWVHDTESSIALLINTCHDLEGPFLDYLARETGKPILGVGPLLPGQYWEAAGSLVRDSKIRTNKEADVTEERVIEWLDNKPRGSVIYISFGSSLVLTDAENAILAEGLLESTWPFIWVVPSGPEEGYFPHGLAEKVGSRGLVIRGWAPQLVILSHISTGGFLSHCGWNSTVESIGRGVPFLAWPIRGDQFYDAKLVASHLRVGYMVADDIGAVKKEDIVSGIERLMSDREVKEKASKLSESFKNGFPKSALDKLSDLISKN